MGEAVEEATEGMGSDGRAGEAGVAGEIWKKGEKGEKDEESEEVEEIGMVIESMKSKWLEAGTAHVHDELHHAAASSARPNPTCMYKYILQSSHCELRASPARYIAMP